MSGTYPDVPSWRFAYDRDGTNVTYYDVTYGVGSVGSVSAANVRAMNDEGNGDYNVVAFDGAGAHTIHVGFYFPSTRDIDDLFLAYSRDHSGTLLGIDWSTDSTDPLNGTWTAFSYAPAADSNVSPDYRNEITAAAASSVKAIRIRCVGSDNANFDQFRISAFHIFGGYTSTLRLWDPSSDVELGPADLDFGDVAQGETYYRTFRVKNLDGSRTATGIVVSTDVLTDASVPLGGQLLYSDGGAYASSLNIGNLAAGAISGVVTLQYTVAGGADLGPWAWRTVAEPAGLA